MAGKLTQFLVTVNFSLRSLICCRRKAYIIPMVLVLLPSKLVVVEKVDTATQPTLGQLAPILVP